MKSVMIEIPMQIESRNTIDQMHWAKKRKMRQTYQLFIRQQMSKYNLDELERGTACSIHILTFRNRRIRDEDNLYGGAKQLLDAMVNEGFLYDDDVKHLPSAIIGQIHTSGEVHTIIRRHILE